MALRRNRFGNRRTVGPGGVLYDSKAEAERAQGLELLRRAGKIDSWTRGDRVTLIDRGPGRRVTFKLDFYVHANGDSWAEDVKGRDRRTGKPATMTDAFRIKALLWASQDRAPLRVVDKYGNVLWEP